MDRAPGGGGDAAGGEASRKGSAEEDDAVLVLAQHGGPGERRSKAPAIRKRVHWTPEEDAVLLAHERKHGAKHWRSSIRSSGLLLRPGSKACRIRWANKFKFRQDHKDGKFSAEEERVVLDLQPRFGNKWATIARHLPGRRDDRQALAGKKHRAMAEAAASSPCCQEGPSLDQQVPCEGSSSSGQCPAATPWTVPATDVSQAACSSNAVPLHLLPFKKRPSFRLMCTPPVEEAPACPGPVNSAKTAAASVLCSRNLPCVESGSGSFLNVVPFEGTVDVLYDQTCSSFAGAQPAYDPTASHFSVSTL